MRQKFIYAFAAAALTAMIVWRVTTGVDLTDESFYLVTARSILEWGAYNVDKSVAQTAPMFDVPFLYLWQAIAGRGADGLIIALRAAFFCAMCAFVPVPLPLRQNPHARLWRDTRVFASTGLAPLWVARALLQHTWRKFFF